MILQSRKLSQQQERNVNHKPQLGSGRELVSLWKQVSGYRGSVPSVPNLEKIEGSWGSPPLQDLPAWDYIQVLNSGFALSPGHCPEPACSPVETASAQSKEDRSRTACL